MKAEGLGQAAPAPGVSELESCAELEEALLVVVLTTVVVGALRRVLGLGGSSRAGSRLPESREVAERTKHALFSTVIFVEDMV